MDYHDRSVVLSGDTRVSENLIQFAAGVDVIVHEVAAARDELLGRSEGVQRIVAHHTRPEEAGVVFDRLQPRLAVYSHIVLFGDGDTPPPSLEDLVASTRTTYSGPLEVGVDLMRIEIGDAIEIQRLAPP